MRIRTQFRITTLLFWIILLLAAASAIITDQRATRADEQEMVVSSIGHAASELDYLCNVYMIHREDRQLSRWQSKFALLSKDVASLDVNRVEQQALVRSLKTTRQRLEEVFHSMVSTVGGPSGNRSAALDPKLLQVLLSRMAVQSQSLISDASRLSHLLRDEADQLRQARTMLIYGILGIFGVFLLLNYAQVIRHVLKSIATLQAGTAVIGSGNLDFIIEEKKEDEIGDLSRAFNRMTADLRAVTASQKDLEREIAGRKRAEEELSRLNESLEHRVKERTAELTAANQELDAFAYAVSHDLRAPLRALSGFSQALVEDYGETLQGEAHVYLNQITRASQHMGQLIDGLLTLSRSILGELRRDRVDLSGLADRIREELAQAEPERRVEWQIEPGLSARGDVRMIEMVMSNLLGNAWKYTAGKAASAIRVYAEQDGGERCFYVEDNGAGFDMAYADKLFKPFQRLHRQDEFPGVGIGLATVQRIVHRHGGTIHAMAAPGRGAKFWFSLPSAGERLEEGLPPAEPSKEGGLHEQQ
jgi:signal transduction histidine kinase